LGGVVGGVVPPGVVPGRSGGPPEHPFPPDDEDEELEVAVAEAEAEALVLTAMKMFSLV
jgi:hypothetical protein